MFLIQKRSYLEIDNDFIPNFKSYIIWVIKLNLVSTFKKKRKKMVINKMRRYGSVNEELWECK